MPVVHTPGRPAVVPAAAPARPAAAPSGPAAGRGAAPRSRRPSAGIKAGLALLPRRPVQAAAPAGRLAAARPGPAPAAPAAAVFRGGCAPHPCLHPHGWPGDDCSARRPVSNAGSARSSARRCVPSAAGRPTCGETAALNEIAGTWLGFLLGLCRRRLGERGLGGQHRGVGRALLRLTVVIEQRKCVAAQHAGHACACAAALIFWSTLGQCSALGGRLGCSLPAAMDGALLMRDLEGLSKVDLDVRALSRIGCISFSLDCAPLLLPPCCTVLHRLLSGCARAFSRCSKHVCHWRQNVVDSA